MTLPRLRSPIVLVHGLLGFDRLCIGPWMRVDYFHAVPGALREAGNVVVRARLSPTGGVARRAEQLRATIEGFSASEPVHILAHSMGGMDARYLISRLGMADRVLSLTTLGTPHRGSPFADWARPRLLRLVAPVFDHLGLAREAFDDVTVESCRAFNEQTPNVPGVRYFSVAGQIPHGQLRATWRLSQRVIHRAEGPNDGMVSVTSASWGESSEVWDGDHMSLVNWPRPFVAHESNDRLPRYSRLLGRLRDLGY
jgi:triacylglycerol lipase